MRSPSKAPTVRQLEVLAAVRAYVALHGMPPTLREIADLVGVSSTNGVTDHLRALVRHGLMRHDVGRSRGWRPA